MRSNVRFLVVFVLFCVAGCGSSYDRIETGGTERTNVRLDESASVLVMTPADGGYNDRVFEGSGAIVARRMDASFSRYARLVDVSPSQYHSFHDLKDATAKNGYGYIVVPTILTWGRKDKEWSKIPNQINIKISVIDASTGKEVSSNYLEGKGTSSNSIYAMVDPYGEGPEELLSDSADDYVDTLYGTILRFSH